VEGALILIFGTFDEFIFNDPNEKFRYGPLWAQPLLQGLYPENFTLKSLSSLSSRRESGFAPSALSAVVCSVRFFVNLSDPFIFAPHLNAL
jgi:hypothetical protein